MMLNRQVGVRVFFLACVVIVIILVVIQRGQLWIDKATVSSPPTPKYRTHTSPKKCSHNEALDTVERMPDMCKSWRDLKEISCETKRWWQWGCLVERQWSAIKYKCKNQTAVGNWVVCSDKPWTPPSGCLVYSFGIDNDFSFDDAMAQKFGCTVYSFDPSMGVDDHKHGPNVFFKNLGLGATDSETFNPRNDNYVKKQKVKKPWKIKSLKSIRKMLGHEKKIIDVLKIDIEVYEWEVVENLIKENQLATVRQFLIEWHIFPDRPIHEHLENAYSTLVQVEEKLGFKQYLFRPCCIKHEHKHFNTQGDAAYVNTNIDKV